MDQVATLGYNLDIAKLAQFAVINIPNPDLQTHPQIYLKYILKYASNISPSVSLNISFETLTSKK
jgi:hypothetical protein